MTDVKVGEAGGISVVDFAPFLDGSRKQQVADAIVQSFKDIGFVYLINHGLAQAKIDGMFDWVRMGGACASILLTDTRSPNDSSLSQRT